MMYGRVFIVYCEMLKGTSLYYVTLGLRHSTHVELKTFQGFFLVVSLLYFSNHRQYFDRIVDIYFLH